MRLPQPARVVAALGAGEPHAPQLVEQHLQVAQREAGDRGQLARHAAGARRRAGCPARGVVQASTPVASTASVALARIAEREPPAVRGRSERQQHDEQHERHLDHQPAGEQRAAACARPAPRRPAAPRRSRTATQAPRAGPAPPRRRTGSSRAPCTPRARGAAASRRSRRPRRRGPMPLKSVCRVRRAAAGRITVDKYGAAPAGACQRLARPAELLAVDARRSPAASQHLRGGGGRPCRPRRCRSRSRRLRSGVVARGVGDSASRSVPSASTVPERAARSCIAVIPGRSRSPPRGRARARCERCRRRSNRGWDRRSWRRPRCRCGRPRRSRRRRGPSARRARRRRSCRRRAARHATCSATISAARPPCGDKHLVRLAQHPQRLQGQVLGVARADADADQPHALTSRLRRPRASPPSGCAGRTRGRGPARALRRAVLPRAATGRDGE